jgi:hypothetical protein
MSKKIRKPNSPVASLKNEAARQRWELFHRAIAHAKQSNNAAIAESEPAPDDPESPPPILSIVR